LDEAAPWRAALERMDGEHGIQQYMTYRKRLCACLSRRQSKRQIDDALAARASGVTSRSASTTTTFCPAHSAAAAGSSVTASGRVLAASKWGRLTSVPTLRTWATRGQRDHRLPFHSRVTEPLPSSRRCHRMLSTPIFPQGQRPHRLVRLKVVLVGNPMFSAICSKCCSKSVQANHRLQEDPSNSELLRALKETSQALQTMLLHDDDDEEMPSGQFAMTVNRRKTASNDDEPSFEANQASALQNESRVHGPKCFIDQQPSRATASATGSFCASPPRRRLSLQPSTSGRAQLASTCQKCEGFSICEHNRQRSRCKSCGGSSVCHHMRIKYSCKDCAAQAARAP
jgi:hypothetical protein